MTSTGQNYRIPQRMSSGSVAYDDQRRNLKTAGRPEGMMMNNQGVLMSKNCSIGSMNRSLVVPNRTRMGKSSDANAFRRSIVINNGVLQEQRNSPSQQIKH